jgi:hypothetical protein
VDRQRYDTLIIGPNLVGFGHKQDDCGLAAKARQPSITAWASSTFDNKGDAPNVSQTIFSSLVNVLDPHALPSQ